MKPQKYPAKVGYGTINGLWYEYWNDMSWRPTLWTRIKLLIPFVSILLRRSIIPK
jgi:hypothetical protein